MDIANHQYNHVEGQLSENNEIICRRNGNFCWLGDGQPAELQEGVAQGPAPPCYQVKMRLEVYMMSFER